MHDLVSIIDIGSNSIRLGVYEPDKPASSGERMHYTQMFSKKIMAGLAAYVDDADVMSNGGIEIAVQALAHLHTISARLGITNERVFATASFRDIQNSVSALARLRRESGLAVTLLSKQEEALLAFEGIRGDILPDNGIVADVGGGSTELVLFEHGIAQDALSLGVGSLRLFKRCVKDILPTSKEQNRMSALAQDAIRSSSAATWPLTKTMYCIGGSARALRKLMSRKASSENEEFTGSQLDALIDALCADKKAAGKLILKTCPDRIHTIMPGAFVIQALVKEFGIETVVATNASVREGYLYAHPSNER